MRRFLLKLAALALVFLIASPVNAAISFDLYRATAGVGSMIQAGSVAFGIDTTANGGAFWATVVGGSLPPSPLLKNAVFCLEVPETVSIPSFNISRDLTPLELAPIDNNNDGRAPMTAGAAKQIRQLWAQYFPTLNIQQGSGLFDKDVGAFQLAIWELEYDYARSDSLDYDLTEGYFEAKDGDSHPARVAEIAAANAMFAWLAANPNAPQANLIALTQNGRQDFVGEVVPEPATLVIWSVLGAASWLGMRVVRRGRSAGRQRWSPENRNAIYEIISR